MAWYDEPVSHGYITTDEGPGTDTPHFAWDLETPFHTPLTAPTPGTVKIADYQKWGGEIFVQPDDKSLPEWYMFHPDELDVHVGEHVTAGELIGLSGGENPGYPGAEHPTQPQYSTGPHTHVGWFEKWIGNEPYGPPPDDLLAMAGRHEAAVEQGAVGGGAMGGSSGFNVPSDVYNAVEPIAQQDNVPDALWETVASVESSFNPKVHHMEDTGYMSVGLFQLEQGVGQGAGYSTAQLEDPATNAQAGLPAIATAWNDLKSSFDPHSTSWWQQFAAESGHPGGAPGQDATDIEANLLMSAYNQSGGGLPKGASPASPYPKYTGDPWYSQKYLDPFVGTQFLHPGQGGHDTGDDLLTPLDTPMTAMYGGTIKDISGGPPGGVNATGTSTTGYGWQVIWQLDQPYKNDPFEYAIHLDEPNPYLKIGQHIDAGTLIGWTGGAINAGQVGTASNPLGVHTWDVPPHSYNPHTEVGFMSQEGNFDPSSTADPTDAIHQAQQSHLMYGTSDVYGTGGGSQDDNSLSGLAAIAAFFTNLPGEIGGFLVRVGVGALGVLVIGAGTFEVIGALKGESGGELAKNTVGQVAKVAPPVRAASKVTKVATKAKEPKRKPKDEKAA